MSKQNPLDMTGRQHFQRFHRLYDRQTEYDEPEDRVGSLGNRFACASSGCWSDTKQYTMGILIPRSTTDSDIDIAIKEVESVMKFMTKVRFVTYGYRTKEESAKELDFIDGKWQIKIMVSGHDEEVIPFPALKDALIHIRDNTTEEDE